MFTGPNIVTEGLILALDAGNKKSYPGSGNTWTDLSGKGNNGILQNGATYNGSGLGNIQFDGSDDRVYTTSNLMSNLGVSSGLDNDVPYTMESFFKIHTNPTGIAESGGYSIMGHASTGGIGMQVFDDDGGIHINFGYRSNSNTTFTGQSISTNRWYHVVCTRTTGGTSSTIVCYVDGISIGSLTQDLRVDYTTAQFQIGDSESRIGNLDGNIAIAKVYNRALTSQEVQQNYNATKSRFGLT